MTQATFGVGMIERNPNFGAVVSIEVVTITIPTNTASATVTLTKGQNTSQCVPFFSSYKNVSDTAADSCDGSMLDIDIWNDAGTPKVTASRYSTSRQSIVAVVHVVQFVPDVRVQKVTWSINGSFPQAGPANITVLSVNQARTFVIPVGKTLSTGNGSGCAEWGFMCKFSTNTNLQLSRGDGVNGPYMTASGRVYVVEDRTATAKFFTVTAYDHYFDASDQAKTITAVANMAKTSLIVTMKNHEYTGPLQWGSSYLRLTSTTNIQCNHATATNYGHTCRIYVVEWKNATTVQRGLKTYSSGTTNTQKTFTEAITQVTETKSIVHGTHMAQIQIMTATNIGGQHLVSMASPKITAGGASITWTHWEYTSSLTLNFAWEVISFEMA